jgi:hypothetical protein
MYSSWDRHLPDWLRRWCLSHFLRGLEENFLQLQCTYHKIGLGFNTDKFFVLLFNLKESEHAPVRLGDVEVELVNSIV